MPPIAGAQRSVSRDRYLLDSEQVVFSVRRHWAALAGATAKYALALTVAVVLLRLAGPVGAGHTVAVGWLLLATAWMAWRIGDWSVERFSVTDRRVLLVSGLLTRRVAIMPLRKVTDITYERSILGRALGYGAFVMESAGQHQALSRVGYLPAPDRLYRQMSALLFGSPRAVDDSDDDLELPTDFRAPQGQNVPTAPLPRSVGRPPRAPTSGGYRREPDDPARYRR